MDGQEYFIHGIPALISSRKCKDIMGDIADIECLPITGIFSTFHHHGLIYYEEPSYRFIPITQVCVDGASDLENPGLAQRLAAKHQI